MKQRIGIVVLTALTILMLVGCEKKSSQESPKAEAQSPAPAAETVKYHGEIGPDKHGWLIVADYEKKGDDIIAANFDCMLVNKHEYVVEDGLAVSAGVLKSDLSKEGIYDMKVGGAKMDWHEQIALAEEYYVENDGFGGIKFDESGHDVDGVTSASIHFEEFGEAAAAALPSEEAVYTFANEGPRDSHGWEPFVVYQVKSGKVISADIDCFLGDPAEYVEEGLDVKIGDLKSELSKAGVYDMKVGGAKMDWHEQAEAVASYLIENQSFDAVKFDESGHDVDGVTSASIHFEEFAVLF